MGYFSCLPIVILNYVNLGQCINESIQTPFIEQKRVKVALKSCPQTVDRENLVLEDS